MCPPLYTQICYKVPFDICNTKINFVDLLKYKFKMKLNAWIVRQKRREWPRTRAPGSSSARSKCTNIHNQNIQQKGFLGTDINPETLRIYPSTQK